MTLLEQLGLDPDDFVWQDLALCDGMDPELFYSKYENNEEDARQTDEVCLHCPVMKECGLRGMQGETGVWGGIYWNGSGKPDEARNAHKTPEVWARIRERMSE